MEQRSYPKTAACACGALTVSVTAPPQSAHACTCLDCQRRTGSVFSYTAFFPNSAVTIAGPFRVFRRIADSGRWNDAHFCPDCGTTVCVRMEAFSDMIGVPVGCCADPEFERPATLYWAARRHRWFATPADIKAIDTQ
jgi:hypothetical protein